METATLHNVQNSTLNSLSFLAKQFIGAMTTASAVMCQVEPFGEFQLIPFELYTTKNYDSMVLKNNFLPV